MLTNVEIANYEKAPSGVFITVIIRGDSGEEFKDQYGPFSGTSITAESIREAVRQRHMQGKEEAVKLIAIGTVIQLAKPGPTQEELDLQAFRLLVSDYVEKFNRLAVETKLAGVTPTVVQKDVDDAKALIVADYRPEYAPLIVGLF